MKVLCVGDQHFQLSNYQTCEEFIKRMIVIVKKTSPDFIVLLGDLLHSHERLHTEVLNLACNFVVSMASLCKTFILVGNHDMISNDQFMSNKNWVQVLHLYPLPNLVVVDKVTEYHHIPNSTGSYNKQDNHSFLFIPYVFPGRFNEALEGVDKSDVTCIFAHQEFKGVKMGAFESTVGDEWDESNPLVVSGHVHDKQWVGGNVLYVGSAFQHSFGERSDKTISLITFGNKDTYTMLNEEIDVGIRKKKTVRLTVKEAMGYNKPRKDVDIKVIITGSEDEISSFKRDKKSCELLQSLVTKVQYNVVIKGTSHENTTEERSKRINPDEILLQLVEDEKNVLLTRLHREIFG